MSRILLTISIIITLSIAFKSETYSSDNNPSSNIDTALLAGENFSILLPINHLDKKNYYTLQVIPPKYLKLITSTSDFWEFIPQSEEPEKWSQIMTINFYRGIARSSSVFNDYLAQYMSKHCKNFKILKQTNTDETNFSVASLAATYDLNGKKELICIIAYSGPADLVQVQMTEKITSDDKIQQVQDKLFDTINSVSKVISKN
jgi:hypothetical protein